MDILHLDAAVLEDQVRLHALLARELTFPAWYGGTLDALFDCLTDLTKEVTLSLPAPVTGSYGQRVLKVLRAAAAENPHLHVQVL